MLIEQKDRGKVVTNTMVCPYHQKNPGKPFAGCTCSSAYALKASADKQERSQ